MSIVSTQSSPESKILYNIFMTGPSKVGKTTLLDSCLKYSEPWAPFPSFHDYFEYEITVKTSFVDVKMRMIDYNAPIPAD